MAKAKAETTAIATWDEELAKYASEAAEQEKNTGGGQFFGLKGGILTLNDAQLPNNEIGCVVLDSILENVYYEDDFDADSPASPVCYAFGRDEDTMEPHEDVETKQAENCAACPHAAWGSADKGRGKACRNRRRLALLPAGTFDREGNFTPIDDAAHYEKAEAAFLGVSPTSLKGFAAYVKGLAATLKRPPFGVFTRIKVIPDQKSQFKVTFENLGIVPNELMETVFNRAKAQRELMVFAYPKRSPEAERPAAGRRAGKTARKF